MSAILRKAARNPWLLATLLAAACGSSSSSGGGSLVKGRGTAPCNEWQTAVCGWASRCSSPSAAACQDQANGISCISDDKAKQCADALNGASCTSPPADCDLRDLADPAPAMAACQQFHDEVCSWAMRCDPSVTPAQCDQQFGATADCTKAIGVKLSFEQCVTDFRALSCQATTSPPSCNGALIGTR